MTGWVDDINRTAMDNETFRTVLFTGEHLQLTVMRLAAGEDIGREVHPDNDQFLRIEQGEGRVEFGSTPESVDETTRSVMTSPSLSRPGRGTTWSTPDRATSSSIPFTPHPTIQPAPSIAPRPRPGSRRDLTRNRHAMKGRT